MTTRRWMIAVGVAALVMTLANWCQRLYWRRRSYLSEAAVHKALSQGRRARMLKTMGQDPRSAEKDRKWAEWHARTSAAFRRAADCPWDTTRVRIERPPPF